MKDLILKAKQLGFIAGAVHNGPSHRNWDVHFINDPEIIYDKDYDELIVDGFVIYRSGVWAQLYNSIERCFENVE